MPFGIQVFNEDGHLQLDSDMSCVAFDRKFTIGPSDWTAAWWYSRETAWEYNLPVAMDEIVAVSSTNMHVGIVRHYGVTTHIRALCRTEGSPTPPAPTGTTTFYVFKNKAWAADSSGLECYDASGTRVFSTSNKLLRITNIFNTPTLTTTSSRPAVETYNLPPGRTYAALLSRTRAGWFAQPSSSGDAVIDGVKTSATSITVDPTIYVGWDHVPPAVGYTPLPNNGGAGNTLFAIDVTGL